MQSFFRPKGGEECHIDGISPNSSHPESGAKGSARGTGRFALFRFLNDIFLQILEHNFCLFAEFIILKKNPQQTKCAITLARATFMSYFFTNMINSADKQ